MTMQVQHPVADWYLAFDDLWELMRVNWHTHNTFTQSGMWDAEDAVVKGVVMVVDTPPYRGVLLHTTNAAPTTDDPQEEDDYAAIVTYGPKCNECGYTPYNALWYPTEGGADNAEAIVWASGVITDLFENAKENGIERLHFDECSRLRYPDEPEPAADNGD